MLSHLLEAFGASLVVVGVYWLTSPGWAFVAAGVFTAVLGVLLDLGERPKEE